MNIIEKHSTWQNLKNYKAAGGVMAYEFKENYYQIFVLLNSVKYFINLFPLEFKNVTGISTTNDADLQDFLINFKPVIDANPPYLPTYVDFPNSLKTGDKLQFHESSRPDSKGKEFVTCWAGSGDDVVNHVIFGGDLIAIENEPNVPSKTIDIKFDPIFGEVWLHEGYAMWENAGFGDYLSVQAIAPACPLQPFINKDLVLDGNKVKYSLGGPGTGDYGFSGIPAPVRNHSNTGSWDFNFNTSQLTPNFTNTGKFDIFTEDKSVNDFISRLPIAGTTYSYVMLQSADSTQVISPYFIRIKTYNISNTSWKIWMFVTLYRERTV